MKAWNFLIATYGFLLLLTHAHAQTPAGKTVPPPAKILEQPVDPQPKTATPADEDLFTSAPTAANEAPTAFNAHMIGDFTGSFFLRRIPGPNRENPITIGIPTAARGGIKLAENESPRPVDRVFAFHRNYNNLQSPLGGSPVFDLADTVVGFEKTFYGGNASFEMRLPYYDLDGPGGSSGIGDLGLVFKYALYNNRFTGDVFSTGLMLTLPTGEMPEALYGDVHSTLFQPFVGYIYNMNRFFVHGFSSVVIPTDDHDIRLCFNDVGLGYQLYRSTPDSFISAIIPVVEAHLTSPLGSRTGNAVLVPDFLVLTAGVHVQFSGRATLSFAGATPIAGDDVYDFESMVQFNWAF